MFDIIKKFILVHVKALMLRHIRVEKEYWINRKFRGVRLDRNIYGVDEKTYSELKNYREAEHQIGRFLNIKKFSQRLKNQISKVI